MLSFLLLFNFLSGERFFIFLWRFLFFLFFILPEGSRNHFVGRHQLVCVCVYMWGGAEKYYFCYCVHFLYCVRIVCVICVYWYVEVHCHVVFHVSYFKNTFFLQSVWLWYILVYMNFQLHWKRESIMTLLLIYLLWNLLM